MKYFEKIIERCPRTGRIIRIQRINGLSKIILIFVGFASLIWFLVRVIPKPSRATYPCMRATMPLASGFVIYLLTIGGSAFIITKIKKHIIRKRYLIAMILAIVLTGSLILNVTQQSRSASAMDSGVTQLFEDPLGPNAPIGEARGIFPGRVVWVHNPLATNPDCDPDKYGDGYFLSFNCDQDVVNKMVSDAVKTLVDADTDEQAWDMIFKHYNEQHGKGVSGYQHSERIFIKVNSVHAWSTDSNGEILNNSDYGNVDTSPQFVLAVLDQLIEKAGVPQEMIYIGDPFTRMFNHCFELWDAKYPDVHYLSRDPLPGREVFTKTTEKSVYYSDKGSVLSRLSDKMVDQVEQADYLLNLPAFKAHRWGGVTFFSKNHFGSHARGSSSHLHFGLHRIDYGTPLRDEYKSYRVFVDLMATSELGGKTLVYLMDGLWGTSEEHLPPTRFLSEPFKNHWSSSVLASLDPVAIESVCLDILQKEFKTEDMDAEPPRYTFVQWNAVDDYLHQAADASWWPEDIIYDPDNTGNSISSLGVHEHWNNQEMMEYSRNLKTGDGIELIKRFADQTSVSRFHSRDISINIFPNPATSLATISITLDKPASVQLDIHNLSGAKVMNVFRGDIMMENRVFELDTRILSPGIYNVTITAKTGDIISKENRRLLIVRQ